MMLITLCSSLRRRPKCRPAICRSGADWSPPFKQWSVVAALLLQGAVIDLTEWARHCASQDKDRWHHSLMLVHHTTSECQPADSESRVMGPMHHQIRMDHIHCRGTWWLPCSHHDPRPSFQMIVLCQCVCQCVMCAMVYLLWMFVGWYVCCMLYSHINLLYNGRPAYDELRLFW